MIKRLLRNLRQKPKVVRDNIALGIAGIFTFIVGSFWLYNFPAAHSLDSTMNLDEKPAFSGLFSDFKDQIASLKESADELKGQATGTPETNSTRERIDIKDLYPSTSAAQTGTTTTISSSTTSTSTFNFSTGNAATTTPAPVNTYPNSPQVESSRSIRIVTTGGSASTSATTTFSQ